MKKFLVGFIPPQPVADEVNRIQDLVSASCGAGSLDPRVLRVFPLTRPFSFMDGGPKRLAGQIKFRLDQGLLIPQIVSFKDVTQLGGKTICVSVDGLQGLMRAFYDAEDLGAMASVDEFGIEDASYLPLVEMVNPSLLQQARTIVEENLELPSSVELHKLTIWEHVGEGRGDLWQVFQTVEVRAT